MDQRGRVHRWRVAALVGLLVVALVATVFALCRGRCAWFGGAGPAFDAPPGFQADGPLEHFTEDDLYLKVDGRDSMFQTTGFRSASCRRFVSRSDATHAFEACAFVMQSPWAAMSIYLRTKRPEGRPSSVARHAYESSNALFLAQGDAYVEIVSGGTDEETAAARRAFAEVLVPSFAGEAAPFPPFPAEGQVPDRLRVVVRDAFGQEHFDGVYTVEYEIDGHAATAFWAQGVNPDDAAKRAATWVAWLKRNGATSRDAGLPDVTALDVLGFSEWVCVRGRTWAGVHQAEDVAMARDLAGRLCGPPGAGAP